MSIRSNVVSGTYDVTVAGDRQTVAHGLTNEVGEGVIPDIVLFENAAADADGALTAQKVSVVSKTATNVVIRGELDVVAFVMVSIQLRDPITEA